LSVRALAWPLLCLALLCGGCSQPYKVGDYVLVEWEEGKLYPAYITEVTKSRYRVHFEGYDSRWDDDFGIERIKGRVEGPVVPPPPPEKVARASRPAAAAAAADQANAADGGVPVPSSAGSVAVAVNQFKPGDRVRVTWRGSVYSAVVLEIVAQDRVLLHYEGHENVWDEVVQMERIVSRRQ
jgi:hypothetical protein